MKKLNLYIQESILDDDKDIDNKQLKVRPKDKSELVDIIVKSFRNKETDLNFIDTSLITDMSNLFFIVFNKKIKNQIFNLDLSNWDVSNVKSMHEMFDFFYELETLDISNWNTKSLTSSSDMFYACSNLRDIKGIENLNVSNVTDTSRMFDGCTKFNQDLSNWDVSNVVNMRDMFANCKNLEYNLDKWKTKKIKKYNLVYNMFYKSKLYYEDNLPKWYLKSKNK